MYKLRPPRPTNQYLVFVSSSDEDETNALRERVKGLVDEVINPQLLTYPEARVELSLRMSERSAAQRVPEGEHVNRIFVDQVRESALTIGLLLDEVRPGTEEELVEALEDPAIQVAIHIFDRKGEPPEELAKSVEEFLAEHRDKVYYDRCGDGDSNDAWFGVLRTLLRFTFAAMRDNDPRKQSTEVEVR